VAVTEGLLSGAIDLIGDIYDKATRKMVPPREPLGQLNQ